MPLNKADTKNTIGLIEHRKSFYVALLTHIYTSSSPPQNTFPAPCWSDEPPSKFSPLFLVRLLKQGSQSIIYIFSPLHLGFPSSQAIAMVVSKWPMTSHPNLRQALFSLTESPSWEKATRWSQTFWQTSSVNGQINISGFVSHSIFVVTTQPHHCSMKAATDSTSTSAHACVPKEIYLWALKFEFYICSPITKYSSPFDF